MHKKFKKIFTIFFIIAGILAFVFVNNPELFLFPYNNGIKIVIDPGHGGSDPGAMRRGVYEKDINLAVAKKLRHVLIMQGFNVVMTRDKDVTMSLWQRTNLTNKVKPNLFISIHTNSSPNTRMNGAEIYWHTKQSQSLAKKIYESFLCNSLINENIQNKGLLNARYYVIRKTNVPSILVEVGYISNYIDRYELMDNQNQRNIAKIIDKGIIQFLQTKYQLKLAFY